MTNQQNLIRIRILVSISLLVILLFSSCKDSRKEQHLDPTQIELIHQFVRELNQSLNNFEFSFIKESWSHLLFKRRIGKLGNIGHGVFEHVYETTIKESILNFNLDLINEVKDAGATLKHIKTNIVDGHAEVTYLLIEETNYHFIKYRINIYDGAAYLSDIYSFKEDRWFSHRMREVVLLNMKHTAESSNRHEANKALAEFQSAIINGDYESAFESLNSVPESHQVFNDFKIAKINTASQLGKSILLKTIEQESNTRGANNIYIDYLIAYYHNDSVYKEDVKFRMRKEIGISKTLLDSLNYKSLIWD